MLIRGGPGRNYRLKNSKLEAGQRELNAVIIMPSFLQGIQMDVTGNWFPLHDPDQMKIPTARMIEQGRKVVELSEALDCIHDAQVYRPGDVQRLDDPGPPARGDAADADPRDPRPLREHAGRLPALPAGRHRRSSRSSTRFRGGRRDRRRARTSTWSSTASTSASRRPTSSSAGKYLPLPDDLDARPGTRQRSAAPAPPPPPALPRPPATTPPRRSRRQQP